MSNDLLPRRAAFVREYLIDNNGTQAAIRAGYSPATAESQACRLLRDAKVRAAIAGGQAKLADLAGITRLRISDDLAVIAFAPLDDPKVRVSDKRQALMDLAKLHGFITERVQMRVIKSVQDLSDDELAALIAEDEQQPRTH